MPYTKKPDALDVAQRHARTFLDSLDTRHVGPTDDYPTLMARFEGALPETGTDAETVIEELATLAEGGLQGMQSGRFFAWVSGSSLPSATAADWLVSAWDQNPALYLVSPLGSVIEERVGAWIKDLFDLPREASYAFVTGCQMAHVTSLAAARHAVLRDVGWKVEEDGLFGAPKIRVLTSTHRHGSVARALRLLGFGVNAVELLAVNQHGQATVESLQAALAKETGPTILILNAGDLNIGMFDNFKDLIPVAKAVGVWVHIDGAFGLLARTSATYRSLTEGIDLADSWATDGHKWLNVPQDSGIAIIRDREAHSAAMTYRAAYCEPGGQARDAMDWNPEWSRRARAIPLYAVLRELGRQGVADLVDRCCQHCHDIVQGIGALAGARMMASQQINQGLIRFEKPGASEQENDVFTDEVIAAINDTGEAYFSGTTWEGRKAMRVSVVSWRTSAQDVARAIAAAKDALAQLGADHGS